MLRQEAKDGLIDVLVNAMFLCGLPLFGIAGKKGRSVETLSGDTASANNQYATL